MSDQKSTRNALPLPCEARPLRYSVIMVALVCISLVLCGPAGAQQNKAVWQSIFHTADGQPVRSPHFIKMLNDLLKNPEKEDEALYQDLEIVICSDYGGYFLDAAAADPCGLKGKWTMSTATDGKHKAKLKSMKGDKKMRGADGARHSGLRGALQSGYDHVYHHGFQAHYVKALGEALDEFQKDPGNKKLPTNKGLHDAAAGKNPNPKQKPDYDSSGPDADAMTICGNDETRSKHAIIFDTIGECPKSPKPERPKKGYPHWDICDCLYLTLLDAGYTAGDIDFCLGKGQAGKKDDGREYIDRDATLDDLKKALEDLAKKLKGEDNRNIGKEKAFIWIDGRGSHVLTKVAYEDSGGVGEPGNGKRAEAPRGSVDMDLGPRYARELREDACTPDGHKLADDPDVRRFGPPYVTWATSRESFTGSTSVGVYLNGLFTGDVNFDNDPHGGEYTVDIPDPVLHELGSSLESVQVMWEIPPGGSFTLGTDDDYYQDPDYRPSGYGVGIGAKLEWWPRATVIDDFEDDLGPIEVINLGDQEFPLADGVGTDAAELYAIGGRHAGQLHVTDGPVGSGAILACNNGSLSLTVDEGVEATGVLWCDGIGEPPKVHVTEGTGLSGISIVNDPDAELMFGFEVSEVSGCFQVSLMFFSCKDRSSEYRCDVEEPGTYKVCLQDFTENGGGADPEQITAFICMLEPTEHDADGCIEIDWMKTWEEPGPDCVYASSPYPSDGAADVAAGCDLELDWTTDASLCTSWADIYLSDNYSDVAECSAEAYQGTTDGPPYVCSSCLSEGTTYYWGVNFDDDCTEYMSPVWTFTTAGGSECLDPSNPFPADGAVDVPAEMAMQLSWTPPDTIDTWVEVYVSSNYEDVLAGTCEPYRLVDDESSVWHSPIAENTTYYWRVVTWIGDDPCPGPVWSFTTGSGEPKWSTWSIILDAVRITGQDPLHVGTGGCIYHSDKKRCREPISQTDVVDYKDLAVLVDSWLEEALWPRTGAVSLQALEDGDGQDRQYLGELFPCGDGPVGFTVCASSTLPPPGEYVLLVAKFAGDIPLQHSSHLYQYGLVFDSDGETWNNYIPSPAFPNDFFAYTDKWYEMTYSPGSGWELKVTDVRRDFASVTSDARVVITGPEMAWFIPRAELDVDTAGWRITAFAHTGDYGLSGGFWSADYYPLVGDPLVPIAPPESVIVIEP